MSCVICSHSVFTAFKACHQVILGMNFLNNEILQASGKAFLPVLSERVSDSSSVSRHVFACLVFCFVFPPVISLSAVVTLELTVYMLILVRRTHTHTHAHTHSCMHTHTHTHSNNHHPPTKQKKNKKKREKKRQVGSCLLLAL